MDTQTDRAPAPTRQSILRLLCHTAALIFALTVPAHITLGQVSSPASVPAPLPPEAQAAIDKGVLAAKQQDYLLAVRYFQDARTLAPQTPEIYFDLGLAESKIPGRELRAMAWLGAYLAANPNATKAAAVKEQINILDAKSQSNNSRLIKTVQDAAGQISDDGFSRMMRFSQVAGLWAGTGDMTSALKAVDLRGDYDTDMAYREIANGQAVAGEIAGAQKSAGLIQIGAYKTKALGTIAVEQIKAGDTARAESTFAAAAATANKMPADARGTPLAELAIVQAKVGDIAGAQKTVALMQNNGSPIPQKQVAQLAIVTAQRTAGDMAGAQKTVDLMPDGFYKTAARTEDWVRFPTATRTLVQPVISDWLKKLDDDGRNQRFDAYDPTDGDLADWCPLNAEPFLDLASYLKSLLASGDSEKIFDALFRTAKTIVTAQNVIDRMVKQQAGK